MPDEMADLNVIDLGALDEGSAIANEPVQLAPPKPELHPAGGDTQSWIEPIAKWRDLTEFVVPYIDTSSPWQDVERQRPIFVDAMEKAGQWFGERGGPAPMTITDDAIEVRLYPKTKQIVFFVTGMIRDARGTGLMIRKECGIPYMLTRDQVGFLKATNRWPTTKPVGELVH